MVEKTSSLCLTREYGSPLKDNSRQKKGGNRFAQDSTLTQNYPFFLLHFSENDCNQRRPLRGQPNLREEGEGSKGSKGPGVFQMSDR